MQYPMRERVACYADKIMIVSRGIWAREFTELAAVQKGVHKPGLALMTPFGDSEQKTVRNFEV